ncbi:MAG: NAD(P)H-dependent oxidoreductase [Burkholderiaceae bacterium]
MHALIVTSHPSPQSLTHAVAHALAAGIQEGGHTTELADIAAEGFQPAFTSTDHGAHLVEQEVPADVRREQARIDRASALVLVYPVYWWSFPGQLKGWIDRVFSNGWAYEETAEGELLKRLGRLPVHLVGIGGGNAGTYERHGYGEAMKTQIDHGIFDFCGAPVLTSRLLLDVADPQAAATHLETARVLGRGVFAGAHPPSAMAPAMIAA